MKGSTGFGLACLNILEVLRFEENVACIRLKFNQLFFCLVIAFSDLSEVFVVAMFFCCNVFLLQFSVIGKSESNEHSKDSRHFQLGFTREAFKAR